MKALTTEPSALILDRIYAREQTRPIIIDGCRGELTWGGGGWGNVAIRATFRDVEILAREREWEDYEQEFNDFAPDRLELYDWERKGEEGYYVTLSDALARRRRRNTST